MPRIPVNFSGLYLDQFIRRGNPGAGDAIFPRFMEENAIFTYPMFPVALNWRLGAMRVQSFTGPAGDTTVETPAVAATAYRYFHAISASHDDAVARNVDIQIRDPGTGAVVAIATRRVVSQGEAVEVLRPIVVGETHVIRAQVNAIGGANQITLRIYAIQQGLASELPGL